MKLACLFSGGKDSTYAIHLAQNQGHDVACLLSIFPKSEESHLLHHPNLRWTKLQSESMNIPQLTTSSNSNDTVDELIAMENLLQNAKDQFQIEGLVHGGIKSKFQKEKFETLCLKLNLVSVAPLWETEPGAEVVEVVVTADEEDVSKFSRSTEVNLHPFRDVR